jgi:hypothetical protein
MASTLTDHEKARVRYHLGYPNVSSIATFQLGQPAAIEPLFILESAMDLLLPDALETVRGLIGNCDRIDQQMIDDAELLAVEQVDEIRTRKEEQSMLKREYLYWTNALCQVFGVMRNPYDKRFQGGGGINISVQH